MLNINIPIRSNTAKKRLFNCAVGAIEYYWPIKPLTLVEFIYFWLAGLSLLIGLSIYPNHIESASYNDNSDISNGLRVNNKISKTNGLLFINPNCMESESYNDNSEISNRVDNKVGNEVSFTEEIQPNYSNHNCTKSKYYCNNYINNNRNIRIRMSEKKL